MLQIWNFGSIIFSGMLKGFQNFLFFKQWRLYTFITLTFMANQWKQSRKSDFLKFKSPYWNTCLNFIFYFLSSYVDNKYLQNLSLAKKKTILKSLPEPHNALWQEVLCRSLYNLFSFIYTLLYSCTNGNNARAASPGENFWICSEFIKKYISINEKCITESGFLLLYHQNLICSSTYQRSLICF